MCNKSICKRVTWGIIALFFAAVCVVTGILPFYVQKYTRDTVQKGLTIDPNVRTSDSWSKYLNAEPIYENYYFFNITNLPDVLNGAKPNLQEVGPYRFKRTAQKVNYSFSSDRSLFSYWTYDKFEEDPINSLRAYTDKFVMIEPTYAPFLASSGTRNLSNPSTYPSENKLFAGLIPPTIAKVQNTLTATNGAFLSAVRFLLIPAVLQFLSGVANATAGVTSAHFVGQWTQKAITPAGWADMTYTTPYNIPTSFRPLFTNFEIAGGIPPVMGGLLLNSSVTYSLANPVGLVTWMNAASEAANKAPGQNFGTLVSAYATLLSETPANAQTYVVSVITWCGAFSNVTSPTYLAAAAQTMKSATSEATFNPSDVASWSDIGFAQWGSGVFTRTMSLGNTVNGSPLAPTSPRSVPPEFYAQTNLALSIPVSKTMMSFMSSTAGMYFALKANTLMVPDTTLQTNNVTVLSYIKWFTGTFLLTGNLFGPRLPGGTHANNFGLFALHTPAEILFGYKEPVLSGLTGTEVRYPGVYTANDQDINTWWTRAIGDPAINPADTRYTGVTDFSMANKFKNANGVERFSVYDDLPWKRGSCNSKGHRSDCKVWNSVEVVDGLLDGAVGLPTFRTIDEVIPSIKVWVTQAKRAIKFDYKETVVNKGIQLHRYIPSPEVYQNQTAFPANSNYGMDAETGLVPMIWFHGFDLVLSFPHFILSDPPVSSKFTGLNPRPTPDTHLTYIDVEPYTGATLRGYQRLQLNYRIDRNTVDGGVTSWSKVLDPAGSNGDNLIFPLAWLELGAEIKDKDADTLRFSLYEAPRILRIMQYLLTPTSALVCVALIILIVRDIKFGGDKIRAAV